METAGPREPMRDRRTLTAVTGGRVSRARELMELHVRALFTHDAAGRLVRVNEQDGAPAPRFFLGRAADGSSVRRYRHDVDDALRRALDAAADADDEHADPEADPDPAAHAAARVTRYAAVLAPSAPVVRAEAGPAFRFPDAPPAPHDAYDAAVVRVTEANVDVLHPHLSAWAPDVRRSAPLMALVVDGQAAAVCASVRVTPGAHGTGAHEAGVETAPAFRGRGYAPRVAAAWARAVRALGAEPLYSTSWQNAASRAVARRLGLVAYGHTLHLT